MSTTTGKTAFGRGWLSRGSRTAFRRGGVGSVGNHKILRGGELDWGGSDGGSSNISSPHEIALGARRRSRGGCSQWRRLRLAFVDGEERGCSSWRKRHAWSDIASTRGPEDARDRHRRILVNPFVAMEKHRRFHNRELIARMSGRGRRRNRPG